MSAGDMAGMIGSTVEWLIADTFDVPLSCITRATRPGDVRGWDSLGHSVLLTRVSRKLKLPLSEELAAPIDTVGEFVERLSVLAKAPAYG